MSDPEIRDTIGVTTVEPRERKALVQPYAERPVLEQNKGAVACRFCGHARFRRSRLRFTDLLELLMLRYPLRCMRCSQRQYNMAFVAMLSYAPKTAGARARQPEQDPSSTWQNWTDPSNKDQVVARPLSTAIGARAQRLENSPKPARPAPPAHVPSRRDQGGIW